MVATITQGLIWAAFAVVGLIYGGDQGRERCSAVVLTWYFADSFAIVLAGVIVRMRRLAAKSLPSTAGF